MPLDPFHLIAPDCRKIESGLVGITSIEVAISFSISNTDESWTGSGTATGSRTAYALATAGLSDGQFTVGRGMRFRYREAFFQAPDSGLMGVGSASSSYTFQTDPPIVDSGQISLTLALAANPSNASQVDVTFYATVYGGLFPYNDLDYTKTVTANRYTLAELIGTHTVTLTLPFGYTAGTGTATWTIT